MPTQRKNPSDVLPSIASIFASVPKKMLYIIAAGIAVLLIVAIFLSAINGNSEQTRASQAIQSVSERFMDETVQVEVKDDGLTIANLLSDGNANLSLDEEAYISSQIKSRLSTKSLLSSDKKELSEDKYEATISFDDGISVVTTVMRNGDDYRIANVKAYLTKAQADSMTKEMYNHSASAEQKNKYAYQFADFTDEKVYEIYGINNSSDNKEKENALHNVMAIASGISMVLPKGFEERQKDEETDLGISDGRSSYSISYKGENGQSLSIRSDEMGDTFSTISGHDIARKMSEYWKETTLSVAEGANQKIYDDNDYSIELFYDVDNDLWGYWGNVVFTDGTRYVTYNRTVIVDGESERIITVSYRCDSRDNNEKALNSVKFKELFAGAPENSIAEDGYSRTLGYILGKVEESDERNSENTAESEVLSEQNGNQNGDAPE